VRIAKYGPGSEKLSDAQLELLELEPGVSRMEVQAESERPAVQPSAKKTRQHPGRQGLPADLPRVERILACTPEQCVCKGCGKQTTVIGYEESSQLDVEPAKYFVLVSKREKRACKSCEDQGVVSTPLPPRIIEKCLASDQIVIETVVSEYCDHTPLYRQSAILERDTGVELSRATLDGWVLKVGELQMQEGRGENHQAYLWQYGRPGGTVVFDFRLGRGSDAPKRFLGQFEGLLQTDGYAAYDQIGGPRMVYAACWAHSRRQFFEAVQLNPKDPVATLIVARIDQLFAIDAEARHQRLTLEARHALRRQKARPLLDEIRKQIEAARSAALPGGALAKACNYTLTLWEKLNRFLKYPAGVEQQPGGELDATGSSRSEELDPHRKFGGGTQNRGDRFGGGKLPTAKTSHTAVLPALADFPIRRLPELIPATWITQHPQTQTGNLEIKRKPRMLGKRS